MIININNIPTILNEETTFTLSSIPLGFNLYLKTDSLVVAQEAGAATTDFFNDSYKIGRLYVDSDLCTKVTIKCIQAVTTIVKATIQVEFIKDFGEILELNVTVPEGIDPANVNLSFPKLKYNKKNVATFLIEDCGACWNLFSAMNKKWVDDEKLSFFIPGDNRDFFFHKGFSYALGNTTYTRSTGQYPPKAYEYTDGAGVKRRYAFTIDAWAWMIEQSTNGWAWSVVNADEILHMQDFGISVMMHDIKGVADLTPEEQATLTQAKFEEYAEIDENRLKSLIGRFAKGGSTAAGNVVYMKYIDYPKMNFVLSTGSPAGAVMYKPFAEGASPDKLANRLLGKAFVSPYNLTSFLGDISANASGALIDREFNILLVDRVYVKDSGYLNFLKSIDSLLGEDGEDSLLFASIDEVYEYWFMTKFGRAYKTIDGQKINFKIHAPCNHNFFFKSISCLLSGITDTTGVSVESSNNCSGTSHAISDNQLLVNLDFNTDLLSKVEKYLTIFEENPAQEYAYDEAFYFIQMLKPGVRESYQTRLDLLVSAPEISSISVNNNLPATTRNVEVTITMTGNNASRVMLSEDPTFQNIQWIPFSGSIIFQLSDGYGPKTIYIQVDNSFGVDSGETTINYIEVPLALNGISINNEASVTGSSAVSIHFVYEGTPAECMISEDPMFTGANWIPFSQDKSFDLTDGFGLKTIWAKLRDAEQIETESQTDTIQYAIAESVDLAGVEINGGAASTSNRTISVSFIGITGTPTKYRLAETSDFSGSTSTGWLIYTGTPINFIMSVATGVKTIYAQLQNASLINSSVKHDNITLAAAPVTAVVSFTYGYGNGDVVFDTTTPDTINVTDPATFAGAAQMPLKSKSGTTLAWYYEHASNYYTANAETVKTNANLTAGDNNNPTLSGDTGPYPDRFINISRILYLAGGETNKARIVFTLPVGNYKMRMLWSTSGASQLTSATLPYCFYKIVANGTSSNPTQVGATGYTGINNVDFNAEIDFTVTTAQSGNVTLYIYNTNPTTLEWRPGINLLEIQKLS